MLNERILRSLKNESGRSDRADNFKKAEERMKNKSASNQKNSALISEKAKPGI